MRTALVVGGTGLVGGHLVDQLVRSDDYSVITVLVRQASFDSSPRLKEKVFDFKDEKSLTHLEPAQHVFCCLGTTIKKAGSKQAFRFVDCELPTRFAKWAELNKAESFSIVTSMGADSSSKIFYNKVKGEVEQKIKGCLVPRVQIFRPSLIMGGRNEFRLGEKLGKALFSILNPLMIGAAKKYRGIHAESIARGMIYYLDNLQEGVHIVESDKIKPD
mgnify:FL=1